MTNTHTHKQIYIIVVKINLFNYVYVIISYLKILLETKTITLEIWELLVYFICSQANVNFNWRSIIRLYFYLCLFIKLQMLWFYCLTLRKENIEFIQTILVYNSNRTHTHQSWQSRYIHGRNNNIYTNHGCWHTNDCPLLRVLLSCT